MDNHITFLGIMRLGFSALGLLLAAFILVAIVGGGLISGDLTAITATGIIGPIVALYLAFIPLLGFIGGIGLLKRKSWAR